MTILLCLLDIQFSLWTAIQKLYVAFWSFWDKEVPVDESSPANADIIRYMKSHSERRPRLELKYYYLPYETMAQDEVGKRLSEIGKSLSENSDGFWYGYPVLVHPIVGVIFALAIQNWPIILRLPERIYGNALGAGAFDEIKVGGMLGYPLEVVRASEKFGKEWVFIDPWGDEDRLKQWFRAAYELTLRSQ